MWDKGTLSAVWVSQFWLLCLSLALDQPPLCVLVVVAEDRGSLCCMEVSQHPWDHSKMKHFRSSLQVLHLWLGEAKTHLILGACHPGVCCSGTHSQLLGSVEQFLWPVLAADWGELKPKPQSLAWPGLRVTEAQTCCPREVTCAGLGCGRDGKQQRWCLWCRFAPGCCS